METYYVTAIIKEASPLINKINYFYGNEPLTFKIQAENMQRAIKKLPKSYIKATAFSWAVLTSDELNELKSITLNDIEYEIYDN
jgi:hypothetical protein